MAQVHFSDETLMAYADGEIEESVGRSVEEAMERDPAVARRVAAFQRSRRLAKTALGSHAEPVPAALKAAVEAEIRARESGSVVAFPTLRRRLPAVIGGLAALAASVVVVSVFFDDYVARENGAVAGGPMVAALADPAVGDILDRAASGTTAKTRSGDLRLVSTFMTGAGSLCRELTLTQPAGETQAIACGTPGTEWTITFATLETSGGGDYEPAGADGSLLDAYLAELGAEAPLTGEAEAKALAGGK
ncbi:anti-sigma factor family protein [Chthonobacter albigriseus]|uniref:anti-sigma factor family protein n=1 Tax=Chthonobacter albigriseus TaxID=1683161 RepID=UPI0015EF13C9|nr:hypothetical protein [Chthonobacter albigriseus]